MNKDKKIEMIRRKNERLTQQLEDLKAKLSSEQESHGITTESLKQRYTDNTNQIKEVISELEKIQSEWKDVIADLEKKSKEYDDLIQSVREIKTILIETGLKMKLPISVKAKMFLAKAK